MSNPLFEEAYSFDDMLLVPSYSDVLPKDVTVNTRLTRHISLSVPIVSAAMDTVTEADAAISMAREGGLGFIHRNLEIKTQALEVDKVKKSESGMIVDPVTIRPDQKVAEVLKLMEQYRISGVPVTQGDKLVGIVTNRDLRFETDMDKKVADVMTKDRLVTVSEGIGLEESKKLLHEHRIEKLLVVDKNGRLTGLITIKDIEKIKKYPNACKDGFGRLRVGLERARRLLLTGDSIDGTTAVAWGLASAAAPLSDLDGAFERLLERVARLPVNQLVMHKLAINSPLLSQGLYGNQVMSVFFDGIARHTPEGYAFARQAAADGYREAVRRRDEPFGDFGASTFKG